MSDVWSSYQNRLNIHGSSKFDASLVREVGLIQRRLPDNLSYHTVDIFLADDSYNIDPDGDERSFSQNVAIINSDNLNEKTIISLPGEDIVLGSLINWMGEYWIVEERDANTTIYTKAKLLQCNHLLKWITDDHEIITQWCVVNDGTKYMTGELEDRDFFTTRGDARTQIIISRNSQTVLLNRKNRFLIDDDDAPHKLSYQLTKPLKVGSVYNSNGVFSFTLQEVTATEYDNHEAGIADFYIHFPDGYITSTTLYCVWPSDSIEPPLPGSYDFTAALSDLAKLGISYIEVEDIDNLWSETYTEPDDGYYIWYTIVKTDYDGNVVYSDVVLEDDNDDDSGDEITVTSQTVMWL